jgi:phage FluMu protein gp41
MAKMEFRLKHGLPFGKGEDAEQQYEVVLRELNAGDVIDSRIESERVIPTEAGPRLVFSNELMALQTLRRQVLQVGCLQGPLSMAQLRALRLEDLQLLESHADALDAAAISERLGERGRSEQAPGSD